jgi:hypothetical protein
LFKGLAFETLGPWCKEAIDFINVIGNRLIAESGDSKSKKFLFERISLAIQRGNAASIRGTFPDSALFYYLKFLHCKSKMLCNYVINKIIDFIFFVYVYSGIRKPVEQIKHLRK